MKGLYGIGALCLGLSIWQIVVWMTGVPHYILPSPWRVAQAGYASRALILEHTLVTATEVVIGLFLGTLLGAITAIQLASSKRVQRLLLPLLVFTQAVPVFAPAPTPPLWVAYGIASQIVPAVLILSFPVTPPLHTGAARGEERG